DLRGGRALRQIAYVPDAIPHTPRPPGASADNGVSEVLMADAHQMLVLERAYMSGVGNSLRLYSIDTRQGSDTLALAALAPGAYRPVRKELLVDFAQLGLARLDNTEGMCWGPALPATPSRPAARSLVFVSDDNFNPRQITQFVALEFNR
ncbi:MAG: esterase-like activity of phytase family protein, partial [Burkholderiaceae bacterium]|nr:esterase-like activity of phytase family protein [Burkholderiaceae bacterium]